MRIIKLTGMACIVVALAGCSWSKQKLHRHDNDYVQGGGQIAQMDLPSGDRAHRMGEYYPIPPNGNVDAKPPSLVPPGSNLHSSKEKSTKVAKAASATKTQLVKLKSGDEALVMANTNAKAWGKVGSALKASGFQVLDQDSDMGTYFILDANETNNRITKQTPILRVNLKADQKNTQVTLASHDNGAVSAKVSDRILHQLQQQLG